MMSWSISVYIVSTIKHRKQDSIYEIEAALISHGLEATWVLAVVVPKEHDYRIIPYKH